MLTERIEFKELALLILEAGCCCLCSSEQGLLAQLLVVLGHPSGGSTEKTQTSEESAPAVMAGDSESVVRLVLGVWKEVEPIATVWGEQRVAGMTVIRTRLKL